MTTALYRIYSNEVIKISIKGQTFSDRNSALWGVLTDPSLPDGDQWRDFDAIPIGSLRELGFSKIANVGGNIVRNATQAEIDTFVPAEDDDDNLLDAEQATTLFQNHPQFRKMMVAFADVLKDEFNILRARQVQFQDDVAAASNLGALKTSVASYPVLNPRTLAQLKTAIANRINKDD